MANISFKSITFPGLANKYQVPEISNDLMTQGKAADAKATGDALSALEDQLSEETDKLKADLGKFTVTETETGDIYRLSENDGVISVSASADVTVGNRNIVPNVLNVITGREYTSNGITYVKNADGSITVNGTATGGVSIYVSNKVQYLPNGRYTLSGCPAGGSNATYKLVCNLYNGTNTSTWLNDFGNGTTGIIDSTIESIQMYFYIASGATINATVYPMLELGSTESTYVKAVNETVTANTDIPIIGDTTIWSTSDFTLTKRLSKSEAMVNELAQDVTENAQNIASNADSIAVLTVSATEKLHHFTPNEYSPVCVHHDNFSRTMTGHEIGMNAGGNDTGNNYECVTASDYDDGLTVDNGATFTVDNTRTNAFSLRKIASAHSADFAFETNTPTTDKPVCFGYNVTDIRNFDLVTITKRLDGFSVNFRKVRNGTFDEFITSKIIYNIVANVCAFYVVKGWLYYYLDEQLVHSAYVGDMGSYLYLASYKGYETHFDFVNVFNLVNKVEWNPNHVLDTGISNIPLITTSANEGGYILQNTITRWSDYADKFVLHSTDAMVHNGIRTERSIANLSAYTGNLRSLKLTFDVYFPSTSSDTEKGDIMCQMHDRDGTYRGNVPVKVTYTNSVIRISLISTTVPKGGVEDLIKWVDGVEVTTISTDTWHKVELEIKERYDVNQNPFTRLKIDGNIVFESHKPNCFNDLLGSSPQYGIYKNQWGTGVTTFERYFDNFKITY